MSLSPSKFRVTSIEITDAVNQLVPTCMIRFVPNDGTVPINKDLSQITILAADTDDILRASLPIQGQYVEVQLTVNNTVPVIAFAGYVTHADDFTDPDKYEYNLTIQAIAPDQPHKRQTTFLMSSPGPRNPQPVNIKRFVTELSESLDVNVTRFELPIYTWYGTFDVVRQTLMQVINQIISPFGQFAYLNYYVRWFDPNIGQPATGDAQVKRNPNLSVHQVNYYQLSGRPYQLRNILSFSRTYESYTAEQVIGNSKILCTGGEKYIVEDKDKQNDQDIIATRGTVTQQWEYSSQKTQLVAGFDTWVETITDMEYDIEISRRGGEGPLVLLPTLSENISALSARVITGLNVLNARVVKSVQRNYSQYAGLTEERTTHYQYETKTFNNGVFRTANGVSTKPECDVPIVFDTRSVLTFQETTVDQFPNGERFPLSMQRQWYTYNDLGVVEAQTTANYNFYRTEWVEANTTMADPSETANAEVAFWNNFNSRQNVGGTQKKARQPFGKYRTLENKPLETKKFTGEDCTSTFEFSPDRGHFEINVLGSGYEGLDVAWRIADTQRDLEKGPAHWEIMNVVTPIDLNAHIGFRAKARDREGIIDRVVHTIDEDRAITTITLRKVHKD